ncbi:MAG: O-antigen ligase family protein [Kineosporiaceae bacterium]
MTPYEAVSGECLSRRKLAALTYAPLVLMVASDFKLRSRDIDSSVSGAPDIFVLLELAVYGLLAFSLLAFYPVPQRAPRLARAMSVPGLIGTFFFGTLILSAAISPFRTMAMVRAAQTVIWLALALAMTQHLRREHLHKLAHGFIIVITAAVVIGRVDPQPPLRLQEGRFTWLYVHPVVAGIYLGLSTLLVTAYLITRGRPRPGPQWSPAVYAGLLGLHAVSLITTRTRGALLGYVVAAVVLMLTALRRRRGAAAFLVASIAGFLLLLFSSTVATFLERGESAEKLATLNSRTELWTLAWKAIQEEPWFGHGLSASRGLFLDEIGLGGGHNIIVNLLVDQGGLGIVAFVLLVSTLFVTFRTLIVRERNLVSDYRIDIAMLFSILVYLLVDGMTTEYLAAPANGASGWLIIIIVWSSRLLSDVRQERRWLSRLRAATPVVPAQFMSVGADQRLG